MIKGGFKTDYQAETTFDEISIKDKIVEDLKEDYSAIFKKYLSNYYLHL
jgi:hypothetical protein